MSRYSRRTFLAAVAGFGGMSGCSLGDTERTGTQTSPAAERTQSVTDTDPVSRTDSPTPTPEPCSVDVLPTPTEPTEGGIEPLEYPDLSGSVAESSVGAWAADFEMTLRHNRYVANPTVPESPSVHVRSGTATTSEIDSGYVAGVTGRLWTEGLDPEPTTATQTPTAVPILDQEFGAWYRVSARTVERVPGDSELGATTAPPSFETSRTILCR